MKKQFTTFSSFSSLVALLIILTFTLSALGQKKDVAVLSFVEETSINPHDFNDGYYTANGVFVKSIIGRRSGTDFLSVFSKWDSPIYRGVRVLATLPAYNQDGDILFWYPLGELNEAGFMQDASGVEAKYIADTHPIYVFPNRYDTNPFAFTNNRQAAIMDKLQGYLYDKGNPLGLRLVLAVKFTDKAFNTKEGIEMMNFFAKKNGLSLDGTPMIKNAADMLELSKYELISVEKNSFWDPGQGGFYAITPVIENPTRGAIAPDAFLITVTRDGRPLPGEEAFVDEFGCLQKTGNWCANQ